MGLAVKFARMGAGVLVALALATPIQAAAAGGSVSYDFAIPTASSCSAQVVYSWSGEHRAAFVDFSVTDVTGAYPVVSLTGGPAVASGREMTSWSAVSGDTYSGSAELFDKDHHPIRSTLVTGGPITASCT